MIAELALKYHPPGLAPFHAKDGAYHVDKNKLPAYQKRFIKTFGFYDLLATVVDEHGWFHIRPDGSALYDTRYNWCGNFQENYCTVKDKDGFYFHINSQGKKIYSELYYYVGDFKDGAAVVCNEAGLHTHIDYHGNYTHGKWFIDLDIFHKNYARAKDEKGWFHINMSGDAIYDTRYAMIEPFYNGYARVETVEGALLIIDITGNPIQDIRKAKTENLLHQLSAELVGFWKTQTIYAAAKLNIFNYIPDTLTEIAKHSALSLENCHRLLRALQEINIIRLNNKIWELTSKGHLLKNNLLSAALIWGSDHYQQWMNLPAALKTTPIEKSYFENLSLKPDALKVYHEALSTYSKLDYPQLLNLIDWQQHQTVTDAGGSTGTLLHLLLDHNPHLQGILLDKPEVINLINHSQKHKNAKYYSIDLFNAWPCQSDAIIFARVLHDWSDKEAINLLKTASQYLTENGKIYIFEMVLPDNSGSGGLLDLNMLVMTGGKERSLEAWQKIIEHANLSIQNINNASPITSLLILEKKHEN